MSAGLQYERLQDQLLRLRLMQSVERLPSLLEDAAKRELSYSDFLEELLSAELTSKQDRNTAIRIRMARFPFEKTLESFDFKFQPSLDPKIVRELATCRYIANAENVLLLGPPGVGKSHLAVALGIKACAAGYRTLFTSAAAMVALLTRAQSENRLEEQLQLLSRSKLLIIDEIGYLPLAPSGANLLFQLIAKRYERGSIILTSNQSLTGWGDVFGDPIIATAILDRLLHHSTMLNVKGESYRLKEKRKAGMFGRPSVSPLPLSTDD
jgi:DNA replication protein DnaC